MPAYEYHCNSCEKDFIIFRSVREFETNSKIVCEHCKSDKVSRKITAFFTKTSKKS